MCDAVVQDRDKEGCWLLPLVMFSTRSLANLVPSVLYKSSILVLEAQPIE